MRLLVTGGAGYIGSHTCAELILAGHEVIIFDNLSNSKPAVISRIEDITGVAPVFVQADVRDEDALSAIFSQFEIDAVIHFAGLKAVGESVENPLLYYTNNVGGTLALCRVMARFACRKMIFSSSATVYGDNNPIPFVEGMPLSAINPYGATKLMVEQILTDFAKSSPDMSVALLRYFNPIGAHPSGRIGEDPEGIPNNLLPYIMRVAVGKLPCVNVFGDDYDTPDGTGVRDYIHVVDLALGHIAALQYLETSVGVREFNLGTGRGYSVLEVISAFSRASVVDIPINIAPRRAGDAACYFADATRARDELGWVAKMSLDDMCAHSWNFISQNPDGIV